MADAVCACLGRYTKLMLTGRVENHNTGEEVDCRGRVLFVVTANLGRDDKRATDEHIQRDRDLSNASEIEYMEATTPKHVVLDLIHEQTTTMKSAGFSDEEITVSLRDLITPELLVATGYFSKSFVSAVTETAFFLPFRPRHHERLLRRGLDHLHKTYRRRYDRGQPLIAMFVPPQAIDHTFACVCVPRVACFLT